MDRFRILFRNWNLPIKIKRKDNRFRNRFRRRDCFYVFHVFGKFGARCHLRKKQLMMKENWTKDETVKVLVNRAKKYVKMHDTKEIEKIRAGYKKIMVDHPTQVRCKIEKWVKI